MISDLVNGARLHNYVLQPGRASAAEMMTLTLPPSFTWLLQIGCQPAILEPRHQVVHLKVWKAADLPRTNIKRVVSIAEFQMQIVSSLTMFQILGLEPRL